MNKTLIFLLLLSPLPGQDAATALQHAREVNLERAAKLPNFVADETMVRYKSRHTNPPKWQKMDTIESEIAVKGPDVTRQHTPYKRQALEKGLLSRVQLERPVRYRTAAAVRPEMRNYDRV